MGFISNIIDGFLNPKKGLRYLSENVEKIPYDERPKFICDNLDRPKYQNFMVRAPYAALTALTDMCDASPMASRTDLITYYFALPAYHHAVIKCPNAAWTQLEHMINRCPIKDRPAQILTVLNTPSFQNALITDPMAGIITIRHLFEHVDKKSRGEVLDKLLNSPALNTAFNSDPECALIFMNTAFSANNFASQTAIYLQQPTDTDQHCYIFNQVAADPKHSQPIALIDSFHDSKRYAGKLTSVAKIYTAETLSAHINTLSNSEIRADYFKIGRLLAAFNDPALKAQLPTLPDAYRNGRALGHRAFYKHIHPKLQAKVV